MATGDAPAKGQAIQAAHDAAQKRIAARQDLSPGAQQALAARTYLAHKAQMDELTLTTAGADATRRSQLTAKIFGTEGVEGDRVTNALSLRDAQDRASQIEDPSAAAQMLTRAQESGDDLLARAVGQHANAQLHDPINSLYGDTNGWGNVLEQFAGGDPSKIDGLNELHALHSGAMTAAQSLSFLVPRPSGLPSNDTQVAAIANNDLFAGVQ